MKHNDRQCQVSIALRICNERLAVYILLSVENQVIHKSFTTHAPYSLHCISSHAKPLTTMCRSEEKHSKSVKTENTLTKSKHKCNAQGLKPTDMNSKLN